MKKSSNLIIFLMAVLLMIFAGHGLAMANETGDGDNVANSLEEMFSKGTPSGQIRLGYIRMDSDEPGTKDLDDFAIGGQLKFETASFSGVSIGAAFYTAHSITRPDDDEFNDELTSTDQHYDVLAEAYINYGINNFDLRIGRQQIDTPFADTDDIRMTPHTFEAVTMVFENAGFNLIGGYLTTWQGVDAGYHDDADFDDLVVGSDGTVMVGAGYGNDMFEISVWYYGILDVANIFYGELMVPFAFSENVELTLGGQASIQSDETNTETLSSMGARVEGSLYGAMAELSVYGFTFGSAYTRAAVDSGEMLFGGFGGGPFFTNIDTLVANEFAMGQDADSYTFSIGYDFSELGVDGFSAGYVYGHYEGGSDPADTSADAEVVEHNFLIEYEICSNWSMDAVYVISKDEESTAKTEWDYHRSQIRLNYTF